MILKYKSDIYFQIKVTHYIHPIIIYMLKTLLLNIIILFTSTNLFAQMDDVYNFSWKKEKYVFGASLAVLGTAYFLDQNREEITLEEVMALDINDLSSFNQKAVFRVNEDSRLLSDQFRNGVFLVPLTIFLTKKGKNEWQDIAGMYLETLMVNTSLTFIAQSAVSKIRPFVYNTDLSLEDRASDIAKSSFYSGHVSHVTALSHFTAHVLDDLYPDSAFKWFWRIGAIAVSATTAYLRYDASRHFFSDVAVGYGVGATVGYLIPKLHKINNEDFSISLIPSSSGLMVGARLNLN